MDFVLDSGAKLSVTIAPFVDANNLRKAILQVLKSSAIDPKDVASLAQVSLEVLSSETIEQCLFKCMERVTYNDERLTRGRFDDPKVQEQLRQDYNEIVSKIIEVNYTPFFKRTFSGLKESGPTPTNTPG